MNVIYDIQYKRAAHPSGPVWSMWDMGMVA